ncbi:MAG: 30S ribosomal protein S6 [Cyanobacteria bacterium]|nr:30S ribosomal protein S6 [Cyanobacteriota bacterium]
MSRLYETMYILRPDLGEDNVEAAIERYRAILVENNVENLEIQHRGKRRLAYEIARCREGVYIQMNYSHPDGHFITQMERAMRLNEDTIRYLTVKLDPRQVETEGAEDAEPVAAE